MYFVGNDPKMWMNGQPIIKLSYYRLENVVTRKFIKLNFLTIGKFKNEIFGEVDKQI